ncbi:MAG: SH3 domain-containing protein [Spirochaetaceae bacterium]|jgi:hypothetical protein|nr:SH3 domain-containing protein [Spirochaetaceae bacterium]
MGRLNKFSCLIFAVFVLFSLAACSQKNAGWGVLLWGIDDPEIPSGTVLPVQIRSNIEQAWITIIPDEYKDENMPEDRQFALVPLPHLEFFSSKQKAKKYAAAFAEYAVVYAETMQDGLPIRDKPENNGRRTYRLKEGEIIKILEKAPGVEAISTTGTPLEGDWFKVLTYSGSTGYCFSYRLRMFEHTARPTGTAGARTGTSEDKDLELVLGRIWYPESYGIMINSGRLNLDILSKNYSFMAGISDNKARIRLEKGEEEFSYRKITKTADRTWIFEGTPLVVTLRSESTLEARWEDSNKTSQSETFVTLPVSVENIVNQEKEKRQNKFQALYNRGPGFNSANYGTLSLKPNGSFAWDGIETLPEGMLSDSIIGSGRVDMDYTLTGEMADRYTGAMALRFNAVSGSGASLIFAYTLDNQGLRMEFIPREYVPGRTVNRHASPPFTIYFSTQN